MIWKELKFDIGVNISFERMHLKLIQLMTINLHSKIYIYILSSSRYNACHYFWKKRSFSTVDCYYTYILLNSHEASHMEKSLIMFMEAIFYVRKLST